MATIRYLLLLAIAATFQWTLSESARECKAATDRCVPAMNCAKYSNRILQKEHITNKHLRNELYGLRCQPVGKSLKICCPKTEVGCDFDGARGVCLLQNQCPQLSATTNATILENRKCGSYDGKNFYCCTEPHCVHHPQLCEQPEAPILIRPPLAFPNCTSGGKPGTWTPSKLCDSSFSEPSERVCCLNEEPARTMLHHRANRLAMLSCGTTVTEADKIYNGTHALEGEFPWMARLVYQGGYTCSGTLIHPSYVLTAHHCANGNLLALRLGLRDLREEANAKHMQQIRVVEIIRYDFYDVALLRLSQPAEIEGSMVRPICLPLFTNLRMNVPKQLTIAGWGLTENKIPSDILMKAQLPVISSNATGCKKAHEICIGREVAHSHHCEGDSGGPSQALDVFNGNSRFVQYAVISHGGSVCSNQKVPGKGVLVGFVLDWLLENMVL